MQANNSRRNRRQPAIRILAQEFGESTMSERGPGEFDPGFVITKLGTRVNRLLVAGLLEALEQNETSSGTMWRGQLRDASGVHYFSVGHFDSEEIQSYVEELAALHASGDPLLLMMVAKGRCYTTDEGSVYTSMRPEEIAVIDRARYANWLVEVSEETMKRITDHDAAATLAPSRQAYSEAGIATNMIDGLLTAREFYGDIDAEVYRLMVMRALDIAEGKREVSESSWNTKPMATLELDEVASGDDSAGSSQSLNETVVSIVEQLDDGKGVDLETVLAACETRGFDRESADTALDDLVNQGTLTEPKFAWFKLS